MLSTSPRLLSSALLFFLFAAICAAGSLWRVGTSAARGAEPHRAALFKPARDTTYITGPIKDDGTIDYQSALNDRLRHDVAPGRNANTLLWEALGPQPDGVPLSPALFSLMKMPAPAEQGEYFVAIARYAKEHPEFGQGRPPSEARQQLERAGRKPWSPGDFPLVAAWLKANERPLALVLQASRLPQFYYPHVSGASGDTDWYGLIGAMMPGVLACKEIGPGLAARAMLSAQAERWDDAWQDLLACHRLARLYGRQAEPTVFRVSLRIEQAAGEADLALLALAKPTAAQARAWLHDLRELTPTPCAGDWFDLGGRYFHLDAVMHLRVHGVKFLRIMLMIDPRKPRQPAVADPETPAAFESLDWDRMLRTGNAWADRMAAAHRMPERAAREREFDGMEQDLSALVTSAGAPADIIDGLRSGSMGAAEASKRLGDWMVGFFLQEVRVVRNESDGAEQNHRNRLVAFALAAYRADHGRYPDDLGALAPQYLEAIPTDLYAAGKPLGFRRSAEGFLLYSVGVNGVDEDGRTRTDQPPGDDVSVRMSRP
jgi:hypothetical protein